MPPLRIIPQQVSKSFGPGICYQALINHDTIKYIQIFKMNCCCWCLSGTPAQPIDLPCDPPVIAEELQDAQAYYGEHGATFVAK